MTDAQKSSAEFLATAQNILASNDEAARKQMFGTAMQAVAMLEAPLDTVWRTIMSVSSNNRTHSPLRGLKCGS